MRRLLSILSATSLGFFAAIMVLWALAGAGGIGEIEFAAGGGGERWRVFGLSDTLGADNRPAIWARWREIDAHDQERRVRSRDIMARQEATFDVAAAEAWDRQRFDDELRRLGDERDRMNATYRASQPGHVPPRGFSVRYFWLALGFVALPAGRRLASAVAAARRARRHRRRPGLCRTCGYDLRASPDRCPECGSVRASAGWPGFDATGPTGPGSQ